MELPEDDNEFLTLSLSIRPRHSPSVEQPSRIPPMQTLLSQTAPQTPLQLPPTHSLYLPIFLPRPEPPPMATHLVFNPRPGSATVPEPPPMPIHFVFNPQPGSVTVPEPPPLVPASGPSSRSVRSRRNPTQGPREGKSYTVPSPFPWATNRRATVRPLTYLLQRQISTITGMVQCTKCEKDFEMGFDLELKFAQVWSFIEMNKSTMHDRAPLVLMNPVLQTCKYCSRESVKPVISEKKKSINWLFLLLGQMLGCCTLEQLKYFCKHTNNHRTGAKDRVLYLTYIGLCEQLLDSNGPFG